MTHRIAQVDAFSLEPFGGNPAAVCVLEGPADDRWMQAVANEMNLAETAFLHREGAEGAYRLRWFTPELEVDLCGHATLAAAHVLWEEKHCSEDAPIRFLTRSGSLEARRRGAWIDLDFPTLETEDCEPPVGLVEAIVGGKSESVVHVGRSRFDFLVELRSEVDVANVRPDFRAIAMLQARGVIVTAQAAAMREEFGFDFVSRFFAPAAGVDEDPVTGSAHCALGLYWAKKLGRSQFVAGQLSKRRGVLEVKVEGDRTILGGQAVTVLRGELLA